MQMDRYQSQSRFLDITVISAEELRISNRLIKKNAFVTVRTDACNGCSTAIDREGGSYPTWNQKLQLELPASSRSVAVEVLCKTSSGLKMIGMANMPVSDIVEGYVPAHHVHFLSYRLRQKDGERNGIINLSVRMVGPEYVSGPPRLVGRENGRGTLKTVERNNGGIALGVPVTYGYNM